MKKSLFAALVSVAALTGFHASAGTPLPSTIVGPLTINWSLLTTNLVGSPKFPGDGKSTVTGSGFGKTTNTVQVFNFSDTTVPKFGNVNFLELLSNSFNMSFPAGTKLVTDGGGLFVVDHTGTNQIVDASTVLTVSSTNAASSGVDTVTRTVKFSSTNTTTVGNRAGSEIVILKYDDSALPTSDGTKTTFTYIGESTSSDKTTQTISSTNVVTKSSGTFAVHGFGYGTLRGRSYIIQGTVMGTPSGTESVKLQ